MNIILSNKGETLFQSLKEALFFQNNHPFEKRLVVVEAPLVKGWMTERFAEDLGVAMGIEILYPETFFNSSLINTFSNTRRVPTSHIELSLTIESKLKKIEPLNSFLKNESRVHRTATLLTKLFLSYGTYLEEAFSQWKNDPDWQKQLFLEIAKQFPFPLNDLDQLQVKAAPNTSLHIFCIKHIPPVTFRFLEKIAEKNPVSLYVLTPCHTFWSDLLKEKQRLKLFHKWLDQGLSLSTLEETLQERQPLLANFGDVGKGMASLIEDSKGHIIEQISITSSQQELFEDKLWQDEFILEKGPLTLLQALQGDLLFCESKENSVELTESFSVQVHQTNSSKHEVDVLIKTLFEAFNRGILPKDVLVLAKDITSYLPYIECLFQKALIPYQIYEDIPISRDPSLKGFLHLLDFADGRFEREAVFDLLENTLNPFTFDELTLLKGWTEKVSVFWGFDEKHRDELLKKNHCLSPFIETSASGTWEMAFNSLIHQGIFTDDLGADSTSFELIGRFIAFIKQLHKELKPISGAPKTLLEWQQLLTHLFCTYFNKEGHPIFKKLLLPVDGVFPASTILSHLKNLFNEGVSAPFNQTDGVTLSSLLSKGVVQKKMIALLGVVEGEFPRPNKREPFNLSSTKLGPTVTEIDRMLFLEALTLAEDLFYVSFPLPDEDHLPSLLVTELLAYIKKRFNKDILTIEKEISSFSKSTHSFLDLSSTRGVEPKTVEIAIEEIRHFAKNPLRRYFQKTLGLYLKEEEADPFPSDEPFALDRLTLYGLKEEAFTDSLESVISRSKHKLPFGPFSTIATAHLEKAMSEQKTLLNQLGLVKEEGITFLLTDQVTSPSLQEKILRLPPLKLTLPSKHEVTLIGELKYVYPQGLLLPIKSDISDLIKGWGEYLIYLRLVEKHSSQTSKTLLCLKDGKKWESTSTNLEKYLDYLLFSEHNPSLLLPEFVPSLLKFEPEKALSEIKSKMTNSLYPIHNPYLHFGINPNLLSKDDALSLQTTAKTLFGETFSQ